MDSSKTIRLWAGTWLCMLLLATTACVSAIDGSDAKLSDSSIPIRITSYTLHDQIYDVNNSEEESVGLYATLASTTMNKKRYVSNERYVAVSTGFVDDGDGGCYSGESSCNVFSYYPYQSEGLKDNSYEIEVDVNADQTSDVSYNQSDFMTASASNVTPSSATLNLDYEHRLTRLNFIITVSEGTNIEDVLKMDPQIRVDNLYASATYNINTGDFSDLGDMKSITPYGEWGISGSTLVGKRAVVVPQTVSSNLKIISMVADGKSYGVSLGEDVLLESGKSLNVEINLSKATKEEYGAHIAISDWKYGGTYQTKARDYIEYNNIGVNYQDFDKYPIFTVYLDNVAVYDLCRELLYNNDMKVQAVVAYPYRDREPDLTDGTLLYKIGVDDYNNGGKIVWDRVTNTFTYSGGDHKPAHTIYFTEDGTMSLDKLKNPASVAIFGKELIDARNGSITDYYPLVKIGTQYWMTENLRAFVYRDGKSITKKTKSTASSATAGYYLDDDCNYYYNKSILLNEKLAPYGYRVPTYADWAALKAYVRNDASLLKSPDSWGEAVEDLTDFRALPIGAYTEENGAGTHTLVSEASIFWAMDYGGEAVWKSAVRFSTGTAEWQWETPTTLTGYSIRCVKNDE